VTDDQKIFAISKSVYCTLSEIAAEEKPLKREAVLS
jgi:hypothetical protein